MCVCHIPSEWYWKNYTRIVCQIGNHSTKVICKLLQFLWVIPLLEKKLCPRSSWEVKNVVPIFYIPHVISHPRIADVQPGGTGDLQHRLSDRGQANPTYPAGTGSHSALPNPTCCMAEAAKQFQATKPKYQQIVETATQPVQTVRMGPHISYHWNRSCMKLQFATDISRSS